MIHSSKIKTKHSQLKFRLAQRKRSLLLNPYVEGKCTEVKWRRESFVKKKEVK